MTADLSLVRSILFLPASNPRAIAKAREAGADLVILDLEDAVKPDDKASARQAAVEAGAGSWAGPRGGRGNGGGTEGDTPAPHPAPRWKGGCLCRPPGHPRP